MQKGDASEKRQEKERPILRGRTVLAVCAVILAAGGLLHMLSNQWRAQRELSKFHISSNYLEEDGGASYSVSDWGSGFDILLFNYEKEDIAQISSVDVTYKVTAEHASVRVKKQNGDAVEAANGVYSFDAELTTAYHVLHVTPDAGNDDAIVITVQTDSPCQKTLTAEFRVQNYSKPEYTVTDQNNGTVLIMVNTNDYQDSMTVKWDPDKFSPDCTNGLMASWTDQTPVAHFPVSRDSTYELLFLKKTDDSYAEHRGAATVITLD